MIRKLLVANRGEIAIRAFRAATELGIRTVAVYPYEDRYSLHRQKADESYQIGGRDHPVRAYLDVGAIVEVARSCGADAIYPGYGFLSENPRLAEACERAGITFVGPPAEVLRLAGNKVRALTAATEAGLPVSQTAPIGDDALDEGWAAVAADAERIGYPIFVKAAAGGGGRGLRRVDRPEDLADAVRTARSEALTAFGDATVFLEQAVIRPRHIEVQLLGDATGEVIHLFERDCSVQRRNQKVVEIAPAQHLDPELRERICADAVAFGRAIGYQGAGTVEFLVDSRSGKHVFIEMNPRIQVEHTVTEEVTSVDLVQTQLRIAGGTGLAELGLAQDAVRTRGAALQCRITTEDPAADFRPDTGRIAAYRSPGGAGVRLDGGTYAGAEVLPHFDSMLVKVTCRGRDFTEAVRRASRALAEFRVRGVATNIPFLQALLDHPDFQDSVLSTAFIEEHPDLPRSRPGADRGTRLLSYLADVTVNKPYGERPGLPAPRLKLPVLDASAPPRPGSRQVLAERGAEGFARWLRERPGVAVTDTTLRDAHQSLLATRVRTHDLLAPAEHLARMTPQLLSLEAWGGATYDVALRFLREDPWERLAALREAVPNLCLQMLLRGRNTVGYTPYPEQVTDAFVAEAARTGIDVFRVFDALNDVHQMAPAIRAVREAGAVAEGTLCYTGDLADPAENVYTLDYYLRLAERLIAAGAHVLCVKDMAGLLRAPAAHKLVTALRAEFELPVHLHTHDTAGGQLATYLAAVQAGVDAIDGASAPLAGSTSQPSLAAIVAATDHTERATGLSLEALCALEPYWAAVRRLYAPFESGGAPLTGRVYRHEIPGGQLSNLRQQAIALGLRDRFEEIEDCYAAANRILGNIVKVTPTSKVVGDLALHLVAIGADPEDFEREPASFDLPDSVIGFLGGELGTPHHGWPEPFRTRALGGRAAAAQPPAVKELTEAERERLAGKDVRGALNQLLFPGPTAEFAESSRLFGDLSTLDTQAFLYGLTLGQEAIVELSPGVSLYLAIDAVGEADERGYRDVFCRMNGQPRTVSVRDRAVEPDRPANERADADDPRQVAAPFSGVVTLRVAVGDTVDAGGTVATIEAMKMEATITAQIAGTVERLAVESVAQVQAGDLLAVVSG